jgi:tRNA (mo5U34)-methyltransferase
MQSPDTVSSGPELMSSEPEADRLRQAVTRLGPWFHNLHLPHGVRTAPEHDLGDFPRWKWKEVAPHLPDDLRGKRALDIGCNAGFYSFALADRGADVVGIDHDPRYLSQAEMARPHLDPADRVRFVQADAYDLVRHRGRFDVVWFMGVFYHLRYPLLVLDAIARLLSPRGILVFQTLTMPGTTDRRPPADMPLNQRRVMERAWFPKLAFIEDRWASDPSNWFAANPAACEAMLRSAGLCDLDRIADETWLAHAPAEGVAKHPEPDRDPLRRLVDGEDVIGND